MNKRIFLTQERFNDLPDAEQWLAYSKLTRLIERLDMQINEISVAKAIKTKRLHNKGQQLFTLSDQYRSISDQLDLIQAEQNTRREGHASGGRASHRRTENDVINLIRFIWNTYQDGDRPSHAEMARLFWDAVLDLNISDVTIQKWNTACRKAWKFERQDFSRFEVIARFYRKFPRGTYSD